jgi:putative PIN family toxin of toxin-antitoxin system
VRVILDTNVLLSAVMKRGTPPSQREGRFELLTCEVQLAEVRAVSRRPALRQRLQPAAVGSLVNELRHLALLREPQAGIDVAEDSDDDFLLGLAVAGQADYLVTGDRRAGLLGLRRFSGTRILTARALVGRMQR